MSTKTTKESKQFIKSYYQLIELFPNQQKRIKFIELVISYQIAGNEFYDTKENIAKVINSTFGGVNDIIKYLKKHNYIKVRSYNRFKTDNNFNGGIISFIEVNLELINDELIKMGFDPIPTQSKNYRKKPSVESLYTSNGNLTIEEKKLIKKNKPKETNPIVKQEVKPIVEEVIEEVIQPEQSKEEVTLEKWEEENRELIIMFRFLGNKKEYELLRKLKMKYGYDNFDDDDYNSDDIYSLQQQGYLRYNSSTKKYEVTEKYNDVIKEMMIERGVEVKEEVKEEYTQAQLNWFNQPKENNFSIEEEEGDNPDWRDNKVSADDVMELLKITN